MLEAGTERRVEIWVVWDGAGMIYRAGEYSYHILQFAVPSTVFFFPEQQLLIDVFEFSCCTLLCGHRESFSSIGHGSVRVPRGDLDCDRQRSMHCDGI